MSDLIYPMSGNSPNMQMVTKFASLDLLCIFFSADTKFKMVIPKRVNGFYTLTIALFLVD